MKKTLVIAALAGVLALFWASLLFAQWGSDIRLTYNTGSSLTTYNNAWCLAASGNTVHVVWFDSRDGNYEIYYKRSLDLGNIWGNDIRLTNESASSNRPGIAVSSSNVHVVWWDMRDGNSEIYYKRSTNGGDNWGADTRLTTADNRSECPSIAVSSSNIHIVWADWRDGNREIYYKRSTDGGSTWGLDTRLTNNVNGSTYPSVAVSGTNVHVVWNDDRDGNLEIYYKRSQNGGTSWGSDTRLTNATGYSWFPSISVWGSKVHVAWSDIREGNTKIFYKRSLNGGTNWESDVRLTNNSSYANNPSIVASDLNVHVAWVDDRDGNYEIYYKRSLDEGVTWSSDYFLTKASESSSLPSIAVSGYNVLVAWYDARDGNNEIYFKRDPTGNPPSPGDPNDNFSGRPANNSSWIEKISEASENNHLAYRLQVTPNPFISYARILRHEGEKFEVYDYSGRRVGLNKGERIGEGLAAGIYFLRPLGKPSYLIKVMKVR